MRLRKGRLKPDFPFYVGIWEVLPGGLFLRPAYLPRGPFGPIVMGASGPRQIAPANPGIPGQKDQGELPG